MFAAALALAAALAFAASTVGQQRAAARTSDEAARNGRFFLQLLRSPQWLTATFGNAVGYTLQGAALGLGSVLLVQPLLVTSLLFALPLSAHFARSRLPSTVIRAGLLLTASLAAFEVLGRTEEGVSHGSYLGWLVVGEIAAPLVVACVVLAHPRTGAVRAALLAVAVGVLGGVLAVLTKAVVDAAAAHGVAHLLMTGETYALILVGLTVLHEEIQRGDVREPIVLTCPVLAIAATLVLARVQASTAAATSR